MSEIRLLAWSGRQWIKLRLLPSRTHTYITSPYHTHTYKDDTRPYKHILSISEIRVLTLSGRHWLMLRFWPSLSLSHRYHITISHTHTYNDDTHTYKHIPSMSEIRVLILSERHWLMLRLLLSLTHTYITMMWWWTKMTYTDDTRTYKHIPSISEVRVLTLAGRHWIILRLSLFLSHTYISHHHIIHTHTKTTHAHTNTYHPSARYACWHYQEGTESCWDSTSLTRARTMTGPTGSSCTGIPLCLYEYVSV